MIKTVAVIPISGRLDILKITIPKLLKQVFRVILIGNITEDRDSSSEYFQTYFPSADYYYCENSVRRGAKWQYGINQAQDYNPDAILISSSGGVFKDEYFDIELEDVMGSGDLYYLDYTKEGQRMFYWPGYNGSRADEPVGLGRLISSDFLNKCKWNIYPDVHSGLDYRSMQIFRKNDARIKIVKGIPPMRISSYKYTQSNSYDRMVRMSTGQDVDMDKVLKEYGL
jgi:hypothetical protein